MNKEDIKNNQDFEAYIAEKEKSYCELIDKWIVDGPTYRRDKVLTLAKKLSDEKHISADEYDLLLDCAMSIPKAGDGSVNLSFSLKPAEEDPEYKSYIAKVMAMMSFFGHVE